MRHTHIKSAFAATVIVAAAILAPADAWASVTKSGTKYCNGMLPLGITRAYSTGFTEHYPPRSGYVAYSNGSQWRVTYADSTTTGGGFWFVSTNGSLNDPGTYAGCQSL